MENRFNQYWQEYNRKTPMYRAIVVSVVLHLIVGAALLPSLRRAKKIHAATPISYEVKFVAPPPPKAEKKVAKVVAPPPKKEEPKPKAKAKPKKKPKPKPVVKKAEPKPKPKPKVAKKVESKPKPKPEAKKAPPPKPEPKKEEPKLTPQEPVKVAKAPEPVETGVTLEQQLPSELNSWGRLVKRKVEKNWVVPGGIRIDASNNEAVISFWVAKNGRLIGEPEILRHASDPSVALSGLRAVKLAAPYPPLPEEFRDPEQQVVYGFTLAPNN